MSNTTENTLVTDLRAAFDAQTPAPDWLQPRRRQAMDRFEALGLPTRKLEDWKYTSLKGLSGRLGTGGFKVAGAEATEAIARLAETRLPDLGGPRVVFANGAFDAGLSRLEDLPDGVTLMPLNQALADKADLLRPILGDDTGETDSLRALNTALLTDGFLLHVAKNVELQTPVTVLHLSDDTAAGRVAQLRHVVVLDDNSKAPVVEIFAGDSTAGDSTAGDVAWTNIVRDVRCGPGAALHAATIVDEAANAVHTGHLDGVLDRDSRFTQVSLLIGGRTARHEVRLKVDGEGAEAALAGAYLGADGQSFTVFTELDHRVANCRSAQVYRGVLDAGAQAAFQGRVIVREGAQKTDASQSNHNLLLDRSAEADTKPELEIYADDVKCAHGATVGELDADQLFYLESRGLDPDLARATLVEAFVGEIIEKIPGEALKARIGDLVGTWMKKQARKIGGAALT